MNTVKKIGLESDIFSPMDIKDFENHPDYWPGRSLENRYNVVARYQGEENEFYKGTIIPELCSLGIEGDGFVPATRFFHYAYCLPDSEDVKLMVEASKEAAGKDLLVCGSCLSDLSVISKYGSDKAYGFGAGRDFSEVGGAHQPNEYIECDKFLDYTKTIAAYILKVLG